MIYNHHITSMKFHNHYLLLTFYILWTIFNVNADVPEDSLLTIDFPCGQHPIDMFLSRLFDYLEKQEINTDNSLSKLDEILKIKMNYAKLLYAFTPMPKSSYYVYNEIMRLINDWNECMNKELRLKKSFKHGKFLQNINTILSPKSQLI
ncbi:unnamed protein product [Heterobilharzia americana]|nr:unnamed protein product [Heterobilharzia americana]